MAIYTLGSKTVGVPSIGGVIGGEWPEIRILSKDNIVSYHVTLPTKERYLCFVCDFISNKGIYGVWWNAYARGEVGGLYDMGFTKRAPISTIGFFNTVILNLDLNVTNRIKYVIDRGKNELLFYVNGTYIGKQKNFMRDGYLQDTYLDIYPLGLYFISEDESEEISISNASIFYCSDFSTAEKYAGTTSSVRCVGALASDSPPVPVTPLPPTASDFIDVLTPPARVQGGTWSWDTYSGTGISARGEGKGQTGKWLENGTMSGGYPCVQMVRDFNTSGYPNGFIEWNASGLSGGLNPDINYYNKYLLVKMLWQPIRNCGQSTYVTGSNYYKGWNLSIKLNDMETAKIAAITDDLQVIGTAQYGGDIYSFNKVYAAPKLNQDVLYLGQTSTTGVHEFKQLLDLRSGGVSSLFDNIYWTSKQYLYSPKYNNTNNFKLYVSAIGPSAWEGTNPGDPTDWAVEYVKLGGFGVSASKLDNISYNDFLSL